MNWICQVFGHVPLMRPLPEQGAWECARCDQRLDWFTSHTTPSMPPVRTPPPEAVDSCDGCRFFYQSSRCRRHAPVATMKSDAMGHVFTTTEFPVTFAGGWCGDFEKQREES